MAEQNPIRPKTSTERGGAFRRLLPDGDHLSLLAILIVVVLVSSTNVPQFASVGTLTAFTFQIPLLGLLALAMLPPMMTGGLNLATIATTNSCALFMAWILISLSSPDGNTQQDLVAIAVALAAGLIQCIVIGVISGALIAYTGVHPILITLGTQSLLFGICVFVTRGKVASGFPTLFSDIGNHTLFGIPLTFYLLVVVTVIVDIIMRRTPFGVACAMIGSNPEAARFSAIDTRRVIVGTYTMSSVLCFLAACAMIAIFNSAGPAYAQTYLLVTILALVLGGIDPFGGFGRVSGLMLAVAILQVIASGANQLGFNTYLTAAVWGLTLIIAMLAQTLRIKWASPKF